MSQTVLCPRLERLIASVLEELGIDTEEQGAMADESHLTTARLIQAFDHLKRHIVCREVVHVGPPKRTARPFVLNTEIEG